MIAVTYWTRLRMNSRKKFPLARNTVNHLAQFEDTVVSVHRVGELPEDEEDSVDQKNFPEAIKTDILKSTAELFEAHKVYGNDTETEQLMSRFMDGLENYLIDNKSLLQGYISNILFKNILLIISEMEDIKTAGATKIQSIMRGYSTRKKKVKFNDVVEKREFRNSNAIGAGN